MKNFILTTLFIMGFAVSAFAAPVANAGSDMTVMVGEAIRLNGSASTGYKSESQTDGTWSIRWQTGDGYDVENIIKCPHVYTAPGVYTATLTVKDALGVISVSSIRVTAVNIPVATGSNVQTLTDSGNPETNKANLQAAVNRAATNPATNEILIPAGFVFNDALILPARTSTNYVTIRVADLSTLPANTRVTAGDKAKLFTMNMRGAPASGYNSALEFKYGTQYYRIIGMEIRKTVSEVFTNMIDSGYNGDFYTPNVNHVIIDRSLFDGNNFEVRNGIIMNAENMSVLNSSILNIKAAGYETKAISSYSGGRSFSGCELSTRSRFH
ncbi:MAG: PKD domain-containing protein [Pyrinomonadaceae bacterium]